VPSLLLQCKLLEASSIVIDLEGFQPWLAFDLKAEPLLMIVTAKSAVGSNISHLTAMESTTLSSISLGDIREGVSQVERVRTFPCCPSVIIHSIGHMDPRLICLDGEEIDWLQNMRSRREGMFTETITVPPSRVVDTMQLIDH
jgi:hypothetical protein